MKLKRQYEKDADGELVRDEAGEASCIGVEVLHAGPRQNFAQKLVARALAEGWISLKKGELTVHNMGGDDVVYDLVRGPGKHPIQGAKKGQPEYEVTHVYECVRKGA